MSLKQRVIDSIKHKHNWKEDQWGKRCQTCGYVRTKRADVFDVRFRKFWAWSCLLIARSLLISGTVLAIMHPIHEEDMKQLINNSNPAIYVFGCLLLGITVMYLASIFDKEDC